MYKTIRHGENSLQYTILPQNDDFRIDGKLSSAESSCSSSGRKSKTKRPRRRSFFAYLGLIFVCTVIVGAVLIPFLVSAECLPNPTDWFLGKNAQNHDKSTQTGLKGHGSNSFNGAMHSNFIGSGINIGKTVKIINQAGIEKIVMKVNKTNSNTTDNLKSNIISKYQNNDENEIDHSIEKAIDQQKLSNGNTENVQSNSINMAPMNDMDTRNQNQNQEQLKKYNLGIAQMTHDDQTNQNLNNNFTENRINEQHFVTEVRFERVETASTKPPGIIPTIVVTTLRNQFIKNEPLSVVQQPLIVQSQTAPNIRPTSTFSNSVTATGGNNGSNTIIAPTSTLMTRIIQVPLLKSAAKKPIIPPVLVKTNSQFSKSNSPGSIENGELPMATSSPPKSQQPVTTSDLINTNSAETIQEPAKANDWMHSHWPFIDPSTYFQWTGYKAEDSVLLPALLGFALIGMILIITVCLVARNKRTIVSSVRKRNRNVSDVEENGAEDNTTLLTTTNLSDED